MVHQTCQAICGVAAQIKSEPVALHVYVHCLAHCLNLCLQDAARICFHVHDTLELIVNPITGTLHNYMQYITSA